MLKDLNTIKYEESGQLLAVQKNDIFSGSKKFEAQSLLRKAKNKKNKKTTYKYF